MFGVVTAFDVGEHVPDLDAVARSAKEQLVEGGCFVFVVPVSDGLSGPVTRFLDRDPTHIHTRPRKWWLDWTSAHVALIAWKGMLGHLFPMTYHLHVATRTFRQRTPAIIAIG